MRRDFSSFHTSTIPAAFLRRPRDEINPPRGMRAMVRNILRSLTRLRRNRIVLLAVVILFSVGLIVRSKGLWKREPIHVELGVSDVLQDDPVEDADNVDESETIAETTKTPAPNPAKENESNHSPDTIKASKTIPEDDKESKPVPEKKEENFPSSSSVKASVLPNTLIIGAAYSGTNPLASFLSLHPNIAVTQGQLRFFTDNYEKGIKWYSSMVNTPSEDQTIVVERSPGYFYSRDAPARIKKLNASMRLILIVRNPVKRVVSDYTTVVLSKLSAEEAKKTTLEKTVIDPESKLTDVTSTIITNSIYHQYMKRWLDYFPLEQIHVVDGDEFIKNPLQELKRVETFLGVAHELREDNLYFNATSGYFCPKVNAQPHCYGHSSNPQHLNEGDFVVLDKLKNFFRHHNDKLFSLIDQRFEWT